MDRIQNNLTVTHVDYNTILAIFNGKTFFEIFMKEGDLLECIHDILVKTDCKNQKQIDA